ncbi:MAG: hypothetical protein N0A00_02285 [Candidatus Bathyarchaeota archaeon]|nr:hypothetical protein [Candidatus Bathyarchaeota archaeon]
MVKFEVVQGRKGPNDKLVRVWAYGEVFTFEHILRLLSIIFESEDYAYPINEGFQGKAMLLKAIIDVYSGIPIKRVLKAYKLERKKPKNIIIEATKPLKIN